LAESSPSPGGLTFRSQGQPTHHMMSKNEEGDYTVNKKVYGGPSPSVLGLLHQLMAKPKGWPVPPAEIVLVNGETEPAAEALGAVDHGHAHAPTTKPPWLHGKMAKAQADGLLQKDGDPKAGRFLVRTHASEEGVYLLSIMFKGQPTHHKCAKEEQTNGYTINNKQ
jgi:hypothetical protein